MQISQTHPGEPSHSPDPLLTTDDVAKQLSVSPRHVRRLIASGELEVVHIGRCIRVPPTSLDSLIERNRSRAQCGAA